MKPKLLGNRVLLREIRIEDIEARFNLGSNNEFLIMCGKNNDLRNSFNLEAAELWYRRVQLHPLKWVIEYDTKMVGTIGIRVNEIDNKAKLSIEIYDENLYGMGIGSESIKLVLQYGFNELHLNKIYLRVLDFNYRGIACYKKCGFIIEGADREASVIDGKYCTDIYMSILKSEYEKRNLVNAGRNSFV